jgi:hypothetical protein
MATEKRGRWIVEFQGRRFKCATEEEAGELERKLEMYGLPNR